MSRYYEDSKDYDDEIVKATRVIEYVGPRRWVETTLSKSIHGTYVAGAEGCGQLIREVSVTPITVVETNSAQAGPTDAPEGDDETPDPDQQAS